jgi:DNA-binding NarL/FixJ family response regulator
MVPATTSTVTGPSFQELSIRERDLLYGVGRGLSNREIAAELGVSVQTVKNQLSALYNKVGVRNRVQLAIHVTRSGSGN